MKNIRSQIKNMVFCGIFISLLTSCKIVPPTTSDYDTKYDFTKLKSYAWVVAKDNEDKKVTTLEGRRQINAIETILNRKGFEKNTDEGAAASFMLRTHTITDKKVDVDAFYSVWGYYPYGFYSPYMWPHRAGGTISREYEIGTLVLDIIDSEKKEVIWRGSISRKLGIYKNRTPEERASIAMKNADFLLSSFPPGSPK